MPSELGITYRWEDRTVAEQYSRLDINDGDFTTACSEIDASKLDKSIGVYTASGYDDYTGTEYTRPVNVYSVKVSPKIESLQRNWILNTTFTRINLQPTREPWTIIR